MTRLLRFPSSVKRDPAIEVWMREHPGELGAIAQRWFNVMRNTATDAIQAKIASRPRCVPASPRIPRRGS
jgi:sarcosine oxidase delta subunit